MENNKLIALNNKLKGDLHFDDLMRTLYATDASVYRMLPTAVALPKDITDIQTLIAFAKENNTSLIPRTAGTSLAGQCVGEGIVVDVSKHFTKIISVDKENKTVTLQPGVVRDELNSYLKPYGLFFGPNTSTSNRCMIGGMVGNNSSGTTSIQFGVTRDKVLELQTILSDGSLATFNTVTPNEFKIKSELNSLEGTIYKSLYNELESKTVQDEINAEFPKQSIHRRCTGYAIDDLIQTNVFTDSDKPFNMCELLSGSEGTLAFTTQITVKLDDIPPKERIMVAAHFNSIEACLKAVEPAMEHNLYTCEMMDKTILDCTKQNKTQEANRQFIQGDPQAILMCEIKAATKDEAQTKANTLKTALEQSGLTYANVVLEGNTIDNANNLRSAGLGLLGNIIGDKKAVACIEDTAVALPDLANFIAEFTTLMKGYKQDAVYYAHAGAGELHLRPILNLKDAEDVKLFRDITTDVAKLTKKYGGSFSGEHGDGIVRAEFIPLMIGENNYELLKRVKTIFDPNNIFNPNKIVNAYPMDKSLRYTPDREEPEIETLLDFSASKGILRMAEKCNGAGDCRKLPEFGGAMCPSYRATRNEKDTTRARANALREYLTQSDKANKFDQKELKEVFDLCLSCKACASECPSSVDVASLKAEFTYQYQKANGVPLRSKLFAHNDKINTLSRPFKSITNAFFTNSLTSGLIKKVLGVAPERSLPLLSDKTLATSYKDFRKTTEEKPYIKTVYLFNDEFTNQLESEIGLDAIILLSALNYNVVMLDNVSSGRAFISKGLLEEAKEAANKNVALFDGLITDDTPLIGIEPSAILTFKDEYIKLSDNIEAAKTIASNTFLVDTFIANEIAIGNIKAEQFTNEALTMKFHGHCYQKALDSTVNSFNMLNLPKNYKVTIIPSGCCGMAGSFGYEKEHYEVSMAVGEQTLFPAVRKASDDVQIVANGTSCRHQIKDGTSKQAKHPVTILKEALL